MRSLSRVDKLDAPDQVVFDFDPPDGERFGDVRRAALWARDLLDGELGLTSFVRTTGGRGLHVHVGLNRRADFEEVREFAHHAAEVLARRHPDAITAEQRKDKRGSRIYADVMRNAYAQTVMASYGVRARPGAPVATPLSWAEVEDDGLRARPVHDGDDPGQARRRHRSLGRLRRVQARPRRGREAAGQARHLIRPPPASPAGPALTCAFATGSGG